METDKPDTQSISPIERHHSPAPTPAKKKDYTLPSMADEAGMKKWIDDMLSGYPNSRATDFEWWGNSYATQFKTVINMMTQSLRIKEESHSNMFHDKAKILTETKESLDKAKRPVDEAKAKTAKYSDAEASLMVSNNANIRLEMENKCLKEKLKVFKDKLNYEVECNMNLFTTVQMAKEIIFPDNPTAATSKEKKTFLMQTNCMELLDHVDPKGQTTYLIENLPKTVPLYRPEGVTFVKIDNPCTMAMQTRLYADSWDNLNLEELKEKQERTRTTSGSSAASQTNSQTKP